MSECVIEILNECVGVRVGGGDFFILTRIL